MKTNQRAWSPQELQKATSSSKSRVLDLKLRAVTLSTATGQESPHLQHSNCSIRPASCHCSHLPLGATSHCCQTRREAKDSRPLQYTGLVPIHVINLDTENPSQLIVDKLINLSVFRDKFPWRTDSQGSQEHTCLSGFKGTLSVSTEVTGQTSWSHSLPTIPGTSGAALCLKGCQAHREMSFYLCISIFTYFFSSCMCVLHASMCTPAHMCRRTPMGGCRHVCRGQSYMLDIFFSHSLDV